MILQQLMQLGETKYTTVTREDTSYTENRKKEMK